MAAVAALKEQRKLRMSIKSIEEQSSPSSPSGGIAALASSTVLKELKGRLRPQTNDGDGKALQNAAGGPSSQENYDMAAVGPPTGGITAMALRRLPSGSSCGTIGAALLIPTLRPQKAAAAALKKHQGALFRSRPQSEEAPSPRGGKGCISLWLSPRRQTMFRTCRHSNSRSAQRKDQSSFLDESFDEDEEEDDAMSSTANRDYDSDVGSMDGVIIMEPGECWRRCRPRTPHSAISAAAAANARARQALTPDELLTQEKAPKDGIAAAAAAAVLARKGKDGGAPNRNRRKPRANRAKKNLEDTAFYTARFSNSTRNLVAENEGEEDKSSKEGDGGD